MTTRVVVVTGGGGGIGAAVAEELGRNGDVVVTMDPLVSIDGSEQLPEPEETTAGRIVAAGGHARASTASVTDGDAVRELFGDLVSEFGRLDAVVNVAGITRPTSFAAGSEDDWRRVLEVHVDGYRNILEAALPIMSAVGHGRILGVTSGSGWRAADAGAYSCAKRVVASLTWQLGRVVPDGVIVNAMSPIAVTRMVTAALARARPSGTSSATGGLSLGSMPQPEDLGPLGAHLVSDAFDSCRGEVLFAGGSEVAVIDQPRLLEVVRSEPSATLAQVLEAVTAGAWGPAEANQVSGGGTNPRFASVFDEPSTVEVPAPAVRSCAVVTDLADLGAAVTAAFEARGVACHAVPLGGAPATFGGATDALAATVEHAGPVDAVVVALAGTAAPPTGSSEWERVLAEHQGIVGQVHADVAWVRAAVDHAAAVDRPVRVVTLTDAASSGGRSRAQAAAQLARASRAATAARVSAFAVSVEAQAGSGTRSVGELAAHLACSPSAVALSGAELAAGDGWFGVRSHPRPSGSVVLGGPPVPDWLDETLREMR